MEMAWCSKCHADVSLAHAVAELPCPACGGTSFFLMADDGQRETLLFEAERMMRLGRWPDAADALKRCFDRELISAADLNLSVAASPLILSASLWWPSTMSTLSNGCSGNIAE